MVFKKGSSRRHGSRVDEKRALRSLFQHLLRQHRGQGFDGFDLMGVRQFAGVKVRSGAGFGGRNDIEDRLEEQRKPSRRMTSITVEAAVDLQKTESESDVYQAMRHNELTSLVDDQSTGISRQGNPRLRESVSISGGFLEKSLGSPSLAPMLDPPQPAFHICWCSRPAARL